MVPADELEVLGKGIVANGPVPGSFALNLLRRGGRWWVRKGFGQVAQFDVTLGAPVHPGGVWTFDGWGLQECLGAAIVEGEFGHLHEVSVFRAHVYVTEAFDDPTHTDPLVRDVYVVFVYDVDADVLWEEPLHRHTSQVATGSEAPDMYAVHAQYETAEQDVHRAYSFHSWLEVVEGDEFWFTTFRGSLLFGNSDTGCWIYTPAALSGTRGRQVSNACHKAYSGAWGESPLVRPLSLVPGLHRDARDYLERTEFLVPSLGFASEYLGRMLYVIEGVGLYLSDEGFPASIIPENVLPLFGMKITALAELNGSIWIFTSSKTILWTPGADTDVVLSGGRIFTLSDSVGCSGPRAWAQTNQSLVWVDKNGVWTADGSLGIRSLSAEISLFFDDKLTHPLTCWYAQEGKELVSEWKVPAGAYAFDPQGAHVVWCPGLGALFVVQPGQKIALCLSEGEWSLWCFSSVVGARIPAGSPPAIPTPYPRDTDDIRNPRMTATVDRVWVLGSLDQQLVVGDVTTTRPWKDLPSNSAYLLEYGVGGALERNVQDEDTRRVGWWQEYVWTYSHNTRFYVGAPIGPLPPTFVYPLSPDQSASPNSPDRTRYDDWLFPVWVVPERENNFDFAGFGFTGYDLRLRFNSDHWRPVLRTQGPGYSAVNTELNLVFPPERVFSIAGYSLGVGFAPSPGTFQEAQVYNSTTGLPDPAGNEIRIQFNGTAFIPPGTWTDQPALVLAPYAKNLLLYIPMRRRRAVDASQDVNAWVDWLLPMASSVYRGPARTFVSNVAVNIHRQTMFYKQAFASSAGRVEYGQEDAGRRRRDNVAQPVDWAYRSMPIEVQSNAQRLKLRGVRAILRSSGKGTEIDSGDRGWGAWPAGLVNWIFGSDTKEVTSQLIDHDALAYGGVDAIRQVTGKDGVRARFWSESAAAIVKGLWGSSGTWASEAQPDEGDFLVADDQSAEVQVSDSVRGKQVRVMVFGHVFNKAASVGLESIKALLRSSGLVGRKGRNS